MQVLGEAYSTHDEEDMAVKEVTAISISQGRYVQAAATHMLFMGLVLQSPAPPRDWRRRQELLYAGNMTRKRRSGVVCCDGI